MHAFIKQKIITLAASTPPKTYQIAINPGWVPSNTCYVKWNTKWKDVNDGQNVRSRDYRVVSLTGFILSPVSSLYCLVWYHKECELQLHKVEIRQQLEQLLGDHRELTDALTAEILLREENTATQARV